MRCECFQHEGLCTVQPPPSALSQTPVSELLDDQHGDKLSGQPISILVASGPFTLDNDLSYAPLEALIGVVRDGRPDVLIMVRMSRYTKLELIAAARPLRRWPTS